MTLRQAPSTTTGYHPRLLPSPFPAIDGCAFLSDREVNALVAPSGNVEWLCLPRPDAPSVFGAMLDRAAGGLRLGPDEVMGSGRAPIPARHHGAGDDVADLCRVGHRARRPADRALAQLRTPTGLPAAAGGSRGRAVPAAHRPLRQRHGRVGCELRSRSLTMAGPRPGGHTGGAGTTGPSPSGPPGAPALHLTSSFRLGLQGREASARNRLHEGDATFVVLS